jgi:hypothetical protein
VNAADWTLGIGSATSTRPLANWWWSTVASGTGNLIDGRQWERRSGRRRNRF